MTVNASSNVSGTISSPGIGSGLDVSGIVSQLVAIERQPIQQLQSAAQGIQTQISAYSKVQSLVSAVHDAAAALSQSSLWTQTGVTSSNTAVATVGATGSGATGTYSLTVTQLASAQSLASAVVSSDTVGAGKLSITVAGKTVDLQFDDANTTLAQMRDRINAAGAGVTAAIVKDASGERLTLTSSAPGAANTIGVTATDLNGNPIADGLGQFTYPGGMTETQPAANAKFKLNGLDIESASNQLDGVIEGLSITLTGTSASPVSIVVGSDSASQSSAVKAFVSAYNALNTYLAQQTKYDDSTQTAGVLQGDSAATGLRGTLRTMLRANNGASSVFQNLSAIGFDVQKDGTITLSDTKLNAALAQPAELGKLFANTDYANANNVGIARRFRDYADALTGYNGSLTARSDGLQTRLKRNQDDQSKLSDRVAATQDRLMKQYQALDTQLAQMNSLQAYVTQQMTLLMNQSKG